MGSDWLLVLLTHLRGEVIVFRPFVSTVAIFQHRVLGRFRHSLVGGEPV
jgi:hypothetical protein